MTTSEDVRAALGWTEGTDAQALDAIRHLVALERETENAREIRAKLIEWNARTDKQLPHKLTPDVALRQLMEMVR